ncbi:PREDICTED: F-box/WD repeat-containing protein pof11 [Nicrophorus vespilloides]|uniref:F-box/WD repeat-containing protein pof11 n=1 Tax=Nicrophorus vespilloides TaxID=110193 RepID=A0ABM1MAT1_NICVS|nr:PREDICTED: F-box/WD repeat-containing protein pof11 [Nicrophorus vespilloides]
MFASSKQLISMPLHVKKEIAECDRHSYDVATIIFHNGSLYSGADDGKIIKWDTELQKVAEAEAHLSSIYALAASDDVLYSCSNDGTIKSWSFDLKPLKTLATENCEFWKIQVEDGVLFAGDDQGNLRIYEQDSIKGLILVLEPFKDMSITGNSVYSGKDSEVVVTEFRKEGTYAGMHRMNLRGRAPMIACNDKLVVTGESAKGLIIYENHKKVVEMMEAHEMIINAIIMNKGKIYSGGWDRVVKVWSMDGKEIEKCPVSIVINTMVYGNDRDIFVAGGDGIILKLQDN